MIDIVGSLVYFDCGFVIYSNVVKYDLLGVKESILVGYGVVSDVVVWEMVLGVLWVVNVDFVVLISGVVGFDGGIIEKLVGIVWFVFVICDGEVSVIKKFFFGDCDEVRL